MSFTVSLFKEEYEDDNALLAVKRQEKELNMNFYNDFPSAAVDDDNDDEHVAAATSSSSSNTMEDIGIKSQGESSHQTVCTHSSPVQNLRLLPPFGLTNKKKGYTRYGL